MTAPDSGAPMSPGMAPQKIRFDVIGEAWKMFQQNMGPWIMAGVAYIVAVAILYGLMFVLTLVLGKISGFLIFLVFPIMGIVFLVAFAYFITGLYNMALK